MPLKISRHEYELNIEPSLENVDITLKLEGCWSNTHRNKLQSLNNRSLAFLFPGKFYRLNQIRSRFIYVLHKLN